MLIALYNFINYSPIELKTPSVAAIAAATNGRNFINPRVVVALDSLTTKSQVAKKRDLSTNSVETINN